MQTLAEYLKESQNNSRLNKDNFLSKLDSRIINDYAFNEDLYEYNGDIELTNKTNPNLSIFVYKDDETDEINASVPENRWSFKTEDEAIDFINKGNSAEMAREEVQHCINNNDKEAAKALVSKFNLKTI